MVVFPASVVVVAQGSLVVVAASVVVVSQGYVLFAVVDSTAVVVVSQGYVLFAVVAGVDGASVDDHGHVVYGFVVFGCDTTTDTKTETHTRTMMAIRIGK